MPLKDLASRLAYQKDWAAKHRVSRNESNRRWRENNPSRWREVNRAASARFYRDNIDRHLSYRLKSLYGISLENYLGILKTQQGGCGICGGQPKGRRRFDVDHDHETGKVRGLLCGDCNRYLGFVEKFLKDPNAKAVLRWTRRGAA